MVRQWSVRGPVATVPHLRVEGFWGVDVDVLVIEERIREVCRSSTTIRIGADPARWSRTLDVLAQEGYPALEWPLDAVMAHDMACDLMNQPFKVW